MMYESDSGISFQSNMKIKEFPDPGKLDRWLQQIATDEKVNIDHLAYQFVSDEELLEMNKTYLNHDTYTDILTFPYSYNPIRSDVCISIERVRENALIHGTDNLSELLRVIVHGLLHMCGYQDDTIETKAEMRRREDLYLHKW
jgi:rRNA maturation RNase YbeY